MTCIDALSRRRPQEPDVYSEDFTRYVPLLLDVGTTKLELVSTTIKWYINEYDVRKDETHHLLHFLKAIQGINKNFSYQQRNGNHNTRQYLYGHLQHTKQNLLNAGSSGTEELHLIDELLKFYRKQKATRQIRSQHQQDSNNVLKAKIASYEEQIDNLTKEIDELKKKEHENLDRISSMMMAQEIGRVDANENLMDKYRPSYIKKEFRNLYVNSYGCLDADMQDEGILDDKERCKLLLDILFDAFDRCGKRAEEEKEAVKSKLSSLFSHDPFNKEEKVITKYMQESICSNLKEKPNPHILQEITKGVDEGFYRNNKEIFSNDKLKNEYSNYVSQCVEVTWLMQCSNPPLFISTEMKKFHKKLHQRFSGRGDYVDYYIWPTLFSSKHQFQKKETAFERGDVKLTAREPKLDPVNQNDRQQHPKPIKLAVVFKSSAKIQKVDDASVDHTVGTTPDFNHPPGRPVAAIEPVPAGSTLKELQGAKLKQGRLSPVRQASIKKTTVSNQGHAAVANVIESHQDQLYLYGRWKDMPNFNRLLSETCEAVSAENLHYVDLHLQMGKTSSNGDEFLINGKATKGIIGIFEEDSINFDVHADFRTSNVLVGNFTFDASVKFFTKDGLGKTLSSTERPISVKISQTNTSFVDKDQALVFGEFTYSRPTAPVEELISMHGRITTNRLPHLKQPSQSATVSSKFSKLEVSLPISREGEGVQNKTSSSIKFLVTGQRTDPQSGKRQVQTEEKRELSSRTQQPAQNVDKPGETIRKGNKKDSRTVRGAYSANRGGQSTSRY